MPVNLPDTYFTDLTTFSALEITGDDAEDFLQSQLTSDIKLLRPGMAQYSSWCNPQGRIITTLLIQNLGDKYILLVPEVLIEQFKNQLSIYILRSKVSIVSLNDTIQLTGISGKELINTFQRTAKQFDNKDVFFIYIPDGLNNRSIMITNTDSENKIIRQMPDGLRPSPFSYWQYQDIVTGIVWLTSETTTHFIPQELGLQRLNALSFDKGCYPGQEVIARLHYRGKEKYGLYRGVISGAEQSPAPGDRLYVADKTASIGSIVSILEMDDGETYCLASINHDNSEIDAFSIENKWTANIQFTAVDEDE